MSDREKFEDRCHVCDRRRATDEDYARIGEGLGEHLCWGRWDVGQCESAAVDWRARYVALSSRDSTPTEGVGKRVAEEWDLRSPGTRSARIIADLAQRIDSVAAPRMTLDLRELHVTEWPSEEMAVVTVIAGILAAIRAQLPNVDIITDKEPQS